jgi:hypothetical protein
MENKTITIYELLGLIKDGKAPRKIKALGFKMTFFKTAEFGDYKGDNFDNTLSEFRIIDCLTEKVEILDETNDEFEDIKELNIKQEYTDKGNLHDYLYYQDSKYALSLPQKLIIDNQNKIIRNQKKIIKKAKSNLECQLKTAELVKECEEQRQKLEKIIK